MLTTRPRSRVPVRAALRGALAAGVGVEQALRAITIDAAWSPRLDRELGSIAPGKRADLVVLDRDPLDVRPERIRDIAVWGTLYARRIFQAPRAPGRAVSP